MNCTYDYLRRRPAHQPLDELGEPDRNQRLQDPGRDADAGVAGREVRHVLRNALRRLTPVERTVFLLRDVEGLPTKEIAFIVKCTRVTVRRHSSKARMKLREVLARRLPHLAPEEDDQ